MQPKTGSTSASPQSIQERASAERVPSIPDLVVVTPQRSGVVVLVDARIAAARSRAPLTDLGVCDLEPRWGCIEVCWHDLQLMPYSF
jgi:hypothetical protein